MARTRASTSPGVVLWFSALRIGTYSIVARDEMSGDLGVAVHSHWFSVGSIVSWAQPGRGRGGDPVDRRAVVRAVGARAPGGRGRGRSRGAGRAAGRRPARPRAPGRRD